MSFLSLALAAGAVLHKVVAQTSSSSTWVPGSLGTWEAVSTRGTAPTGFLAVTSALPLYGAVVVAVAPAPAGSGSGASGVYQFDVASGAWGAFSNVPGALAPLGDLTALGGSVIALGSGGSSGGWGSSISWLPAASWASAAWSAPRSLPGAPSARIGAAGAAFTGTYYLFGGALTSGAGAAVNDLYSLDLADAIFGSVPRGWTQLTATGAAGMPMGRSGHTFTVYSDDVVLFGGRAGDGVTLLNDAWEFTPGNAGAPATAGSLGSAAWTPLASTGAPPPRYGHAAAIIADELYIFGGQGAAGPLADLWVLDIGAGAWSAVTTSGATPLASPLASGVFLGHYLWLAASGATPSGAVSLYRWTATQQPPGSGGAAGAGASVTVILPEAGIQAGLVLTILLLIAVVAITAVTCRRVNHSHSGGHSHNLGSNPNSVVLP